MSCVDEINKKYLCLGCGACEAICPKEAIKMELNDVYMPKIDTDRCILCGNCIDICPGISPLSLEYFLEENQNSNNLIGRYISCYFGHTTDFNIRYDSSSGGIATSLICHLLENKLIDGAILTKMDSDNPLRAESFIARTTADVITSKGSKYCPTSPVKVIKQIRNSKSEEKFAFVGLPCHINAIRKLQKKYPWIKEKIVLSIGIFCSHGVTEDGTINLFRKFDINSDEISSLRYRGHGWPGGISINYKNSCEVFIPLREYWVPLFSAYFFTPPRCLTCSDLTAELADISLGDAWLPEIEKNDNAGTSIIITRSEIGEQIINSMEQKNEVRIINSNVEKIIRSQKGIINRKKINIIPRINILKFFGIPIPNIDITLPSNQKHYFGAFLPIINVFFSDMKIGQRIINIMPLNILKKYSKYVLKHCK